MFKIALVGAGGMADTHARGYSEIANAKLVGVLDHFPERAEKLANQHDCRAFTSLQQMFDETQPDIVDVSSPTPTHIDYVRQAFELPLKAVFVEKPMGRTVAECEEMISMSTKNGIPLFVAHVLRFFPEYMEAKRQIDAGTIGNPASVRMRRGGPFPKGKENWYGDFRKSGGVLLDLIIHDLDWLRWTFGDVERVYAKNLGAMLSDGEVMDKDFALLTMRFSSGVMAHVEGTWADPGGFKVNFEVAGDNGLLEFNFNQPSSIPYSAAVEDGGQRTLVAVPESPVNLNPYTAELAHFMDCLENNTAPRVTPQDGLEAVRISESAIESARTGKVVTINKIGGVK